MTMWGCPRCGGTLTCYCPTQPTKKEGAMAEFDPSKPVMTIAGVPATIICTSKRGEQSIVALVHFESGDSVVCVSENGGTISDQLRTEFDLVNIPESKWMNLYDDPKILALDDFYCPWHSSRDDADSSSEKALEQFRMPRIAVVERTASGEFITTAVEK